MGLDKTPDEIIDDVTDDAAKQMQTFVEELAEGVRDAAREDWPIDTGLSRGGLDWFVSGDFRRGWTIILTNIHEYAKYVVERWYDPVPNMLEYLEDAIRKENSS